MGFHCKRLLSLTSTTNYLPWIVGYYNEGFLAIQRALHQTFIEYLNPNSISDLENFTLLMERYPYPPYRDDIFLSIIQLQLPFFIILSMIFLSLNIPKDIALEKEKKLKVISTLSK